MEGDGLRPPRMPWKRMIGQSLLPRSAKTASVLLTCAGRRPPCPRAKGASQIQNGQNYREDQPWNCVVVEESGVAFDGHSQLRVGDGGVCRHGKRPLNNAVAGDQGRDW